MISNTSYWDSTPFFTTDDFFSSPMDLAPPMAYNQYDMTRGEEEEEEDDEIFSLSETEHSQPSTSSGRSPEMLLSNLVCGVCGAPASGYNFDQITCESCKAFFRRNALRNKPNLKCRFTGSCVINVHTRRQCTYCRLKKCFDINMRKEWIRTDEEKELRQLQKAAKAQRRLNRLANAQQPQLNLPIVVRKKKRLAIKPMMDDLVNNPTYKLNCYGSNRVLSDEVLLILNNITNAYQLGADKADCSHVNKYSFQTKFSQFLNDESNMHGSLIWYYKSIPDFKQSNLDDQLLLIKSNVLNIIHLHHIILQNFQDNPKIGEHMSKWIDPEFHYQMAKTRRYFYRFTKYPLLLKLTLIVFIFSMNLSIPDGSTKYHEYKDPKKLYECQNFYTTVLWNYLSHLFDEKDAIHAMEIIVTQILRYQQLMVIMKQVVQYESKYDVLHSLMQSIFGLS